MATGDLTGDGLPEVMLTSNLHGNHLYLNKGHFHFQDITKEAGIGGKGLWATGVTFADVNGDGLLDIYVCYAGNIAGKRRANELYINQGLDKNGVPTFKEEATQYGLADEGFSIQAAFFDYDRDGFLDMYLVNNSPRQQAASGCATSATFAASSAGTSSITMTATGILQMSATRPGSTAARSLSDLASASAT